MIDWYTFIENVTSPDIFNVLMLMKWHQSLLLIFLIILKSYSYISIFKTCFFTLIVLKYEDAKLDKSV
jgi:hypothetical protein